MKKCILTVLGAIAALSLPVSCSDEFGGNEGAGNGRISPVVDLNTETVTSRSTSPESRAAASRATEVTVADLSLRLTKNDGSFSGEWPIAEFPIENAFTVGDYTLEAFYGDPTEQGFDLPAYSGSQTITVRDGETATPQITATLANSMVTIKYTDAFTGYMADYGASVNGIEYGKEEERAVYVTPGDVEIKVNVKKPNGIGAEFTLDKVDALPRHHYTVTIDLNNGGAGDAQLNVTFDDMMDTEEVNIDLSDKLLSTPAPVITPKGFTSDEAVMVVTGMTPEMNLVMNLVAMAGLGNVTLETTSTSLVNQGWPAEIDLLKADGSQQSKLTSMGLDVVGLWKNPAEMAVVTFSDVVKNIKTVKDDPNGNISTFTLKLKDKIMRETVVSLVLDVKDVELELSMLSDDIAFEPGAELSFNLTTNATEVKDKITFEYKDPVSARFRTLPVVNVSAPRSRAMQDYTITVKTPEISDNLIVRAVYESSISNEIVYHPFAFNVATNNVFATYALAKLYVTKADLATARFTLASEGSNVPLTYTVDNGYAKITGLTPDTDYTIGLVIDGLGSRSFNFRTEANTALENGSMENWSTTQKTAGTIGRKTCTVYDCIGWSTFNAYTTSTLNSSTEYSAISSTQSTSEAHSGAAALIQSVGFGSSAGSSTLLGGDINAKYFSQGELYLGSYTGTSAGGAVYGMDFTSRPSSLTFWYKYVPSNPLDKGYAELTLYAADGSTIATSVLNLDATDVYTQKTLALTYPLNGSKASKISVIFRSTNAGDTFLNAQDIPQITSSGILGTTNLAGYYVGSKLYIDDVQLNY